MEDCHLRFFSALSQPASSIISKPLHKDSRGLKNSINFNFKIFQLWESFLWNNRWNLVFETIDGGVHTPNKDFLLQKKLVQISSNLVEPWKCNLSENRDGVKLLKRLRTHFLKGVAVEKLEFSNLPYISDFHT